MRTDGPILKRVGNQARQDRTQAIGVLILIPIQADGTAVSFGEALREGITEIGRQPRARDARDFGVFELLAWHPTQALAE